MADIVIREVVTNIWTFSKPFTRSRFVPFGGRSTAIKLASGAVWVLASTPLSAETKQTLADLGPVKYLIAPDIVHYLYLEEYTKAYPDAEVYGPQGLPEKLKNMKIEVTFKDVYSPTTPASPPSFAPEITAQYFSGHKNREIAFLHAPSRTLIEADLILNLPATEQYSHTNPHVSPRVPLIGTLSPFGKLHPWLTRFVTEDKAQMRKDAAVVNGWDFERIIPCHGDVIETRGKEAWRAAFSFFL